MGGDLSWERTGSEEEVRVCEAREPEGLSVDNEKASLILGIMLREMVNEGLLLSIRRGVAGALI